MIYLQILNVKNNYPNFHSYEINIFNDETNENEQKKVLTSNGLAINLFHSKDNAEKVRGRKMLIDFALWYYDLDYKSFDIIS